LLTNSGIGFWPLLLILLGVIMLAERAALAVEGGYPPYTVGHPIPARLIPGHRQAFHPTQGSRRLMFHHNKPMFRLNHGLREQT
jgi:hypothetical protein